MPDWDENSPQLNDNLLRAARQARDNAFLRRMPDLEQARSWHRTIMADLETPNPAWVGSFRGEPGLEEIEVRVGRLPGCAASKVAEELRRFISRLSSAISVIDETVGSGPVRSSESLNLVVKTAAWAHAEWVRIHPFANGNGRTARLWANWVLMRFQIPPFVRLRPRPEGESYAEAGAAAMRGDWRPTLRAFEAMMARMASGL